MGLYILIFISIAFNGILLLFLVKFQNELERFRKEFDESKDVVENRGKKDQDYREAIPVPFSTYDTPIPQVTPKHLRVKIQTENFDELGELEIPPTVDLVAPTKSVYSEQNKIELRDWLTEQEGITDEDWREVEGWIADEENPKIENTKEFTPPRKMIIDGNRKLIKSLGQEYGTSKTY